MAPDTAEARLARLDEALKNAVNRLEAMSEAYAPTNRQVIENGLRIAEMREDMIEMRTATARVGERSEDMIRKLEGEMLVCATGIGELEKRLRQEQADREAKERNDRTLRNRWVIGILAAGFFAVFCVWLGTVLPT